MKSLFFLLILLPTVTQALEMQWIRLVHYQQSGSKFESEIDSPAFFISPKGKHDPEAELQATIEAFQNENADVKEEDSLICRFPARYEWLKQTHKLKERSCPRYQKWFQTLRGDSVSLVFSSYYLNNPSSAFGHTLLRINKEPSAKDGRRYELLDYGINYAANADTSNALLYAVKGLFGGFKGTFTNTPYYYKVREYNNAESRDLWEYELTLKPEQVNRLLAHVWELGPNAADYWYLTENCSYFMIALLESGDPTLPLTKNMKKFVIPSDTVQVVWDTPGLVKSVKFRPSIRTEFYHRIDELVDEEKDMVAEIVLKRDITVLQKISNTTRKRKVLDAAIDFMDYKYSVEIQKPDTPETKFKNELLVMRGQIDEISETLNITPPEIEEPHHGHGSRMMSAGPQSSRSSGNFLHFEYRFSLHDQLDPVVGYPEYAQISLFDINATYSDKLKKFELEQFSMFEVLSHSPISRFSKSLSWRFKVGADKIWDSNCFGCHGVALTGGAGFTFMMPTYFLTTFYLGVHAASYWIPVGPSDRFLIGAGPQARMRVRLTKDFIFLAETTLRKNIKKELSDYQDSTLSMQKTLRKDFGLRGSWETKGDEEFLKLTGVYYY